MPLLKAAEVEEIVKEILQARKKVVTKRGRNFRQEIFKEDMKEKWPKFAENYKQLFSETVDGELDPTKFNYMMMMLRQIEQGSMSVHSASVKVGEVLVDEYVKPLIEKDSK